MSPRNDDEEQPLVAASLDNKASYQSAANTPNGENINDVHNDGIKPEQPLKVTKGHLLLFVVAILYGTLNVALRGIYDCPDPPSASALSTVRGWMAVVCFAPFLISKKNNNDDATPTTATNNSNIWKVAAELAFWNFGAQGLLNVGLIYIASARAAFLTQLSVVMTPCLAFLTGQRVQSNVWWACGFALAGLVFMSKKEHHDADDGGSSHGFSLGIGDLICLGGALSWSTYLFRLSAVGDQYGEIQLQALKTFFLALLYTVWCVLAIVVSGGASQWVGWNSVAAWAMLFYSALGPGTVADVLQQNGQKTVNATVANIILSLEPVFTAIFGLVLLGEHTTLMEKSRRILDSGSCLGCHYEMMMTIATSFGKISPPPTE